jgi:hypothetical protein
VRGDDFRLGRLAIWSALQAPIAQLWKNTFGPSRHWMHDEVVLMILVPEESGLQ